MDGLISWDSFFKFFVMLLEEFKVCKRNDVRLSVDYDILSGIYSPRTFVLKEVFRAVAVFYDESEKDLFRLGSVFPGTSLYSYIPGIFSLKDFLLISKTKSGKIRVSDVDQAILIFDHFSRISDKQVFRKDIIPGYRTFEKSISSEYKISDVLNMQKQLLFLLAYVNLLKIPMM
ncbi:hypothetical protein ACTFIR_007422 [Dictyostelium discoideum]